ncbi:MAG: DUF5666 domain-containing protein [Saccharospirillum sp.]
MNKRVFKHPLMAGATLSAAFLLAGCAEMTDTAASDSNGASVGPITGFGSVYVNGVRFDTDGISGAVTSDDGIDHEDDLDKGMLLLVDGDWRGNGQGEARGLYYDDTLRGPVESYSWNDLTRSGTLVVLKQSITITDRTVFGGTLTRDAAGNPPAENDLVRVSGWRQSDGTFLASYVGLYSAGEEGDEDYELEGAISNLDLTADTFKIGDLTIVYNAQTDFEDGITESDLRDGLIVEVEGSVYDSVTGELEAEEIELESRRYRDFAGDDIEFSGVISSDPDSNREFMINGLTVRVTDGTEFDDGLTEGDLSAGLEVKIEGDFDANGVVIAEEIEPRDSDSEVYATISNIDTNAQQLTVGGVTVQVNASTLITDDDSDVRIGFSDLVVGDFVEVEGRLDTSGATPVLVAAKLERDDDDDDTFEMEGRIAETDGSTSLQVLGVTLTIDGSTVTEGTLVADAEVEVEYAEQSDGSFLASRIEVDDDDDDDDD